MEAFGLIDLVSFKAAMQQLAATVTVVSHGNTAPGGMTATAVMSLSPDPPSIVLSVNRGTGFHSRLTIGAAICLNALGSHHEDVCKAFGGGKPPEERFRVGCWKFDNPHAPYLADAIANIFCVVDRLIDYGTHSLAIARITEFRRGSEADPLVHVRGGFYALQAKREVWGMPF